MGNGAQIAVIERARRIWAVGSIHGEAERLARLHDLVGSRLGYGDRIVYLGNYLGYGPGIREAVTELLQFRRHFLTVPPLTLPRDIVYLRGGQEEMWQKLLQLQFAVRAREVLDWMLPRGVEATIRAFGADPADAFAAADRGTMALTAWTSALRESARALAGYGAMMSELRHAAVDAHARMLFVSTGIDPNRPLDRQADAFWWAGRSFDTLDAPYCGHRVVVRGYDPLHRGYCSTEFALTVDGGAGFGGPLVAVCLSPDGEVMERLES